MKMPPLLILLAIAGEAWAVPKLNTKLIEDSTGLHGKYNEQQNVFKVTYPRSDLHPEAFGVKLTPPMGLTAWAAFTGSDAHAMVMGDIVLTEAEVPAAMDAALANGLEVTALHNHFFGDSPRILFMHVGGMGPLQKLAQGAGAVFKVLKMPMETTKLAAAIDPGQSRLDPAKLEAVLGAKGDVNQGVVKFVFGREVRMGGHVAGSEMGVNTWAAFAGSPEDAIADGDFAMHEDELQPVLKSLRHSGIQVVAIHNHMTGETPRIVFLHFWGRGAAETVARGVREALSELHGK